MKAIKALFLCIGLASLTTGVFAQISAGGRAGINIAKVSVKPSDVVETSIDNRLGITVAALVEIGISGGFAVQPEIVFVQKGWKEKYPFLDLEAEAIFNYFDVPILLKYKFGAETVKGYFAAGPTIGYAISGKTKVNGEAEKIEDWRDYNRFEIGVSLGAGIGFTAGSGTLFLDARYLLGLSDLSVDEDNTFKNKGISISVGYMALLGN